MQKHRLGLIPRMMRQRQRVGRHIAIDLRQRRIPRDSGGVFTASGNRNPAYAAEKPQPRRFSLHQRGVLPCVGAQSVVDMNDKQRKPLRRRQKSQHMQQGHGIRPAGHRRQQPPRPSGAQP